MSLTLITLTEDYAVWQPDAVQPVAFSDFKGSEFFTISHSADELSVICPIKYVPVHPTGKVEAPWNGFKVEGQLDFALVGIMAQISKVLADNDISLFAISTFDTDYILVKQAVFQKAKKVLGQHFTVKEAV